MIKNNSGNARGRERGSHIFELIKNNQILFLTNKTETDIELLEAEKEEKYPFYYLNDRDILHHYLDRSTNLNNEAKRTIRPVNRIKRNYLNRFYTRPKGGSL